MAQNKGLSSIGADLIRESDTEAQAAKHGLAGGGPDNRRPSQARAADARETGDSDPTRR
ncbi:hypothetical protein [Streptomyces sp. NPDC001893]|uniref:hypothetical protein n=1 Tax=Streptomyces sp. NPDC001893 TaxID=3154530 RepID=UPI00331F69AA